VTPELRELYQSVILDHHRKPHNCRELTDANRWAEGYNPVCGDKVNVYLKLEGDVVKEISFVGSGCAISTAAASLMTDALKGKTLAEAEALFRRFHALLTEDPLAGGSGHESGMEASRPSRNDGPGPDLGKLEAFSGVREFPIRIKCATLPWHTFRAALEGGDRTVSTE
jgi:nitrogen fixation NifU-like protein